MDAQAKRILLDVARAAVVAAAEGAGAGPRSEDFEAVPDLVEPRGAFVTLHDRAGELRGCIGTTRAEAPLVDAVIEMAQAAASRDPRFPPVRPEEVDGLDVEISVLFPLEPIAKPEEVEIGVHGMVAEGYGRRGLLLPQVAAERGWDPEELARYTCVKAGLPPEGVRDEGVQLYRFRCEVFGESEVGAAS